MRAHVTFDTLQYMNELKEGGMDQKEAEAITKATANAFMQWMESKEIVTKGDVKELQKDILALKLSLQRFMLTCIGSVITILGGLQIIFHYTG